ncbi:MAG: alkylhydroperoxidase-related (seleno)protein [Thermoanaerobaculia bacterium]|nr:alkylhydroperoxidase-related (seleno)protein [Thermoanaerobaculia bacterium]
MVDGPFPIRGEILDAHARVLEHWASPGTWWTGAERLAIVVESRRARAADPFPPWVAPSSMPGVIAEDHLLPTPAIDAVWRLAVHPGSLTEAWYRGVVDAGLDPERYVELVAIVATAAAVDHFAAALSLEAPDLPAPAAGEPSRQRPEASVARHWVPTVDDGGAMVLQALSLVPAEEAARAMLSAAQYVPPQSFFDMAYTRDGLDRMQIELVAARTSILNECFY